MPEKPQLTHPWLVAVWPGMGNEALNAGVYLLAAPIFVAIDYNSGMPLWWTIGDSVGCGLLGGALLWCSWRRRMLDA